MKHKIIPVIVVPLSTPESILLDLKRGGYVAVPCDEPDRVLMLTSRGTFNGDDLLMSAMHALSGDTSTGERSKMVKELHRRLLESEAARKA